VTKLTDKNYLGWVYNIKQVLKEHKVWSIVNGQETEPTVDDKLAESSKGKGSPPVPPRQTPRILRSKRHSNSFDKPKPIRAEWIPLTTPGRGLGVLFNCPVRISLHGLYHQPTNSMIHDREAKAENLDLDWGKIEGSSNFCDMNDQDEEHKPSAETFASLGLDDWLVQALSAMSIKRPTPIQSACIRPVLEGIPPQLG
jgi:hypothetical protein